MYKKVPNATENMRDRDLKDCPTSYIPDYKDGVFNQFSGNAESSPTMQSPRERDKPKKDKKWSIGRLFRRKKKEIASESSSDSELRSKEKRIQNKKYTANPTLHNFDHVVINRDGNEKARNLVSKLPHIYSDDGVLSDPSAGFVSYKGRQLYQVGSIGENIPVYFGNSREASNTSLDTPVKKGRKGRIKARVEAMRNSLCRDSSSEEDSQKSSNSSSLQRFRSDDSLINTSRDGSLNKKSRSARTERYIKRLSRDDENQLNKEAELLQQGYTKGEIELLTRTPNSQSSGYGSTKKTESRPLKGGLVHNKTLDSKTPCIYDSISSFPSTRSCPSTINFSARVNNESINYSIPFRQSPVHDMQPKYENVGRYTPSRLSDTLYDNIICVKFPLGKFSESVNVKKVPPVPPPRDHNIKLITPIYANQSPIVKEHDQNVNERTCFGNIINNSNKPLARTISNSVDYIGRKNQNGLYLSHPSQLPQRPASVSAEMMYSSLRRNNNANICKSPSSSTVNQDMKYYADQTPRSRKPIQIQYNAIPLQQHSKMNTYSISSLSNSHAKDYDGNMLQKKTNNASEFWKKIDNQEYNRKQSSICANSRAFSDQSSLNIINKQKRYSLSPSCQYVPVTKTSFEVAQNENYLDKNKEFNINNFEKFQSGSIKNGSESLNDANIPVKPPLKGHVRYKSESYNGVSSDFNRSDRKSKNLDDALNELEAIYNSLGLGDEDLLDRAERRELMNPITQTPMDKFTTTSDTFRYLNTEKLIDNKRRSFIPDKIQDDMAFRRLNTRDRSLPKDANLCASQSYILTSPAFGPYSSDDEKISEGERREPDVIHDDVVYRNIKHSNNSLKVHEPQPPFGIPLGPISPAPQSDYLHINSENKSRYRFIPRKSPDIVGDDLAYRMLRKDCKNSSNNMHDTSFKINCTQYNTSPSNLKKKRAVRSLSANIFSMVQQEIDDALNMAQMSKMYKAQSISNVDQIAFDNELSKYNRVKQRHNTVNLLLNSSDKFNSTVPKNKTEINNSEHFGYKNSASVKNHKEQIIRENTGTQSKMPNGDFQQVLTKIAQDAMDTSNKLGVALAEIDKHNMIGDISINLPKPGRGFSTQLNLATDDRNNKKNNDLKTHSNADVRTGFIFTNEKDLGQSELESKAKKTEDSLLLISDQLQRVEDKIKHNNLQAIEPSDRNSCGDQTSNEINLNINPEDHNLKYKDRLNQKRLSISSIRDTEDLSNLTSFSDLRQGICDLIDGISQVNHKLNIVPEKENILNQHNDNSEYNSSEELATIFQTERKMHISENDEIVCNNDASLDQLNLPENPNILNTNKIECNEIVDGKKNESQEEQPEVVIPWRRNRQNQQSLPQDRGNNQNSHKRNPWYQEPTTLMLACSYTLACSQQLAHLDWLTLLAMILAMVSIVAMLLI